MWATSHTCVNYESCMCHLYIPPDPINYVCSLTGKSISEKYFTYRSVQIIKILFPENLFSSIWSSAQDHAVLVLLLNLVGFFIFTWPPWSGGNVLYHSCTSFEGASRGGQPLNIFTWFIGAGGSWCMSFICGMWVIYVSFIMEYESFIGISHLHVSHKAYMCELWVMYVSFICHSDMCHSYAGCESFICLFSWNMSPLYV